MTLVFSSVHVISDFDKNGCFASEKMEKIDIIRVKAITLSPWSSK